MINGLTRNSMRLELPPLDLIRWLSQQSLYPKVYWKEKEGQITRAALGSLLSFSHIPELKPTEKEMRLYGGIRFSPQNNNDSTWQDFPQASFWLPQVEVTQENDQTYATLYAPSEVTFTDDVALPSLANQLLDRKESPDFPQWQQSVNHVLEEIASNALHKLVFARKSTLRFTFPLSPWTLLSELQTRAKHATLFAFQLTPTTCFLGATPEKLLRKQGTLLETDAVAGTRPRGKTLVEEEALALELLQNPKEQKEFQFVKNFLSAALHPFATSSHWECPKDVVLKTTHVQHLHNRLSAHLKPGVSHAALIHALHPTPALGGLPRDRALQLLAQLEPFDRGWYGAPVGYIGSHTSSLYVAIRSALLHQNTLHLFAGTGIVQGSSPEREWEELNHKIHPFTSLLM